MRPCLFFNWDLFSCRNSYRRIQYMSPLSNISIVSVCFQVLDVLTLRSTILISFLNVKNVSVYFHFLKTVLSVARLALDSCPSFRVSFRSAGHRLGHLHSHCTPAPRVRTLVVSADTHTHPQRHPPHTV